MSPDTASFYQHSSYKKAKSYIQYALHRREGIVVVTGKPGTGKSTLISEFYKMLKNSRVQITKIACNAMSGDELLKHCILQLKIPVSDQSKSGLLEALGQHLHLCYKEDTQPVLVLDEAQTLSVQALEQIRLLTNFEIDNVPLLQVFLLGQKELREIILRPELEQLHQRIVASCSLETLNVQQTREYWMHRLVSVGWNEDPVFAEEIFEMVHASSLGVPRWINLIGSRLLLHGRVEELHELSASDVKTVLLELLLEDLLPPEVRSKTRPVLGWNNDIAL